MKPFPKRPKYRITSVLPAGDRSALEELFFFNDNQARLRESVVQAVKRHGAPKIVRSQGRIRLVLPQIETAQTLYVRTDEFDPTLIGVVVFVREGKNLKILFWALKPDYTAESTSGKSLLLEIVEMVKDIGRRIVEVEYIAFEFGAREYKLRI